MLYHTIIVHLFRPMLKVELIHSDIRPRDICMEAANNVSRLVRIYRSLYDFRVAHLIIPHILLSIGVVHLLFSKDNQVSRQNLVEGLQGLEDLHKCHYFGARSFRIIYTLSKTWNLAWPEELRNSQLVPKSNPDKPQGTVSPPADPLMAAPNTMTITGNSMTPIMSYPPVGHPQRRESLSMFAQGRLQLATHPVTSRPSSVVPSQRIQSPVGHTPTQTTFSTSIPLSTYQYSDSSSSVSATVPMTSTSSASDPADALFWNPIPGMPGPILPRNNYQQISPMGLDSVLQSSDVSDRLGRDGFRINEDWRSTHVNGFNPGAAGSVYGATNDQSGSNYIHPTSSSFAQPGDRGAYSQSTHPQEYDSGWWQHANGNPGPMS
jgi:hypothetical protein